MNGPREDEVVVEGQLSFAFLEGAEGLAGERHESARGLAPEVGDGVVERNELKGEVVYSVEALEAMCREWLLGLELPGAAKLVTVMWNARLKSTAGYASFPAWRIELNPRLMAFEGQVVRTLKHELAHLIAYHRAGRKRIEPHGREWKLACECLGIAEEKACHRLPLPRSRQKRTLAYRCQGCGFVLHRVRRFKRATACMSCCAKHSGGQFDSRFRFVAVVMDEKAVGGE